MKPVTVLRVASVLTLLFCVGHTLGMPWTTAKNAEAMALVDAMKSLHFDAMGTRRSYWDFYFGFGLSISLYLLVQALVLWHLAGVAKTDATSVGWIVAVFFVASVVNAVLLWKFFFVAPLVFAIAIALCLGWALVAIRRI